MSGIGFFELVILFMIGLVVLGPKRLPKVASQLGSWLGQARRMARVMKRQLEEELDIGDEFKDLKNIGDELREDLSIGRNAMHVPRDDDTYSPLHDDPESAPVSADVAATETENAAAQDADTDEAAKAEAETEPGAETQAEAEAREKKA
mgnify:FL=1